MENPSMDNWGSPPFPNNEMFSSVFFLWDWNTYNIIYIYMYIYIYIYANLRLERKNAWIKNVAQVDFAKDLVDPTLRMMAVAAD